MRGKEYIEEISEEELEKTSLSVDPTDDSIFENHPINQLERALKPIPQVTQRHIDFLKRHYGIECEPETYQQIAVKGGVNGQDITPQRVGIMIKCATLLKAIC